MMKKWIIRRILSLLLAAVLLAGGSISALGAENPYPSGIQAGPTASSAAVAPEGNAVIVKSEAETEANSEPQETAEEDGPDISGSADAAPENEAGADESCTDETEPEDTG